MGLSQNRISVDEKQFSSCLLTLQNILVKQDQTMNLIIFASLAAGAAALEPVSMVSLVFLVSIPLDQPTWILFLIFPRFLLISTGGQIDSFEHVAAAKTKC